MPEQDHDLLQIGSHTFQSRLFIGTGKFASSAQIPDVVAASATQLVTVALRRVDPGAGERDIMSHIPSGVTVMPNTSGARTAEEAVRIARLARELGGSDFIKIEVIHDMKYLLPDNEETIRATKILAQEGFVVMPYVTPDPVDCRKLEDAGAATVMPLGSPIGSNQGIRNEDMIRIIIENASIPVVVDAGIGRPSHAAQAMELGADAVLVNTAVASAQDPVRIAEAFSLAVRAGRMAFLSHVREEQSYAEASSPLTGFLR